MKNLGLCQKACTGQSVYGHALNRQILPLRRAKVGPKDWYIPVYNIYRYSTTTIIITVLFLFNITAHFSIKYSTKMVGWTGERWHGHVARYNSEIFACNTASGMMSGIKWSMYRLAWLSLNYSFHGVKGLGVFLLPLQWDSCQTQGFLVPSSTHFLPV